MAARKTGNKGIRERLDRLSYIKNPNEIIKNAESILSDTRNPIDRHFAFNYLEKALYRLREELGMLTRFETTCLQHDSEIKTMLPGLKTHDGFLPVIPMYKQMAINKEKAGDFASAIEWSNRGLAVYQGRCIKKDQEEDLRKRATRLEAKSNKTGN